nr:hypothetical protein [Tanacetum cinerariifolium]
YIQFVARFRKVKPSVAICHSGKLGTIPGVNLQADYQYLQAEAARYQEAFNRNAGLDYGNKNLLDAYLKAHDFNRVQVLIPESDQAKDELVVSAKKQARKVGKEKMAEIVAKLFDKQLVPKSKAERDVAARFSFLGSYMDREAIQAQPELLTKEAAYRRQHNRLAYSVSKR